jgi:hypothetical protein
MKSFKLSCVLLACGLTSSVFAVAQDSGYWRATSDTAKHITGDIAINSEKIAINFNSYWIAQIRALTPSELNAAFGMDANAATPGTGNLYRLSIPGNKKFLGRHTLCADEDVQWLATYTTGRTLQLAFFSTSHMPVLTPEVLTNDPDLCGVFAYVK